MKRFLASLLAVFILVSLLPLFALAVENEAATVADAQEPAQIVGQQLTLCDNLIMRFFVKANMENAAINVTIGSGKTKSVALKEQDANGNYIINVALAAAQMTDTITLQATAGDVTGTAQQFSVRQYAETIMKGEYSKATTDLVQAMLNYGAGAQVYFNYNNTAEKLANKGYESNTSDTVLPERQTTVIEGATEGVTFYGASLLLQDAIALRYYFTGDISNMTVSAGNKSFTVGQKNGLYYVDLLDINPQDYGTVYTVSVGDGENPLSVGYSVQHYISRTQSNGSENLVKLLKSLYAYHLAALSYLDWQANCDKLADFTVVYDDDATENEIAARDMLVEYIQKSTGVQLPIIPASKANYTDDAKYLVIGDTGLADLTSAGELGYRGYRIKTEGSSIFVYGDTDFGTLCGAIGFLERTVGLDAYGHKIVNYEKKSEVLLDDFDLTVVPDIDMEQPPFAFVTDSTKNQALWGNGAKMFSLVEGSTNHWHNSFDYLPPSKYWLSDRDYYVWENALKPVQLSYTANGNKQAFDEMTTICANKIIASAKANSELKAVTLTHEDKDVWDNSAAEKALVEKYGSNSASVILFLNAVSEKVKNGLPGRDVDIYFFAYQQTIEPPTKNLDEIQMDENVGVIFAPIGDDFSTKDFKSTDMYRQLTGWAKLTDNLALWSYQTHFSDYFLFYNSFNAYSDIYRTAAEYGVKFIYNQGQHNASASTGFSDLKSYLIGKLSWDANADVDALYDAYFAARFGSAKTEMRTLFNEMRAYNDELKVKYGIDGGISDGAGKYLRTDRFEKEVLERWIGYINAALAKADNSAIREHILLESLSVRYMWIELYGNTLPQSERVVAIYTFKKDCTDLYVNMWSEGKSIDELWERWDNASMTVIDGYMYNFDLSLGQSSYTMPIPTAVKGSVKGVYDGNYKLIDGVTIDTNSITFSAEAVNTILGENAYGDFQIHLTTADSIYKGKVAIVTKMISSYSDLYAIKAYQEGNVLDGYFALANDFDATGEAPLCLIDFNGYINNIENSGVGFVGIFDGRGHTISNLTVKAGEYAKVGGLFGQILKNAVVKNVAFAGMTTDNVTNHTHLLTGESCRMMGTVENMVISAKGSVKQVFGFIGCDMSNTEDGARGTMTNVVVSGVDYLAFNFMNVPTIQNVIAVTDVKLTSYENNYAEDGSHTSYGNTTHYASVDEMFAALNEENSIAQWKDCDITYANTAIKFNGKAIITELMNIVENEAVIGGTTNLTVQGSVKLSLKEAVDGVSLSGNSLTVASSVKEGTKVTVVATSTVSGVTKEFVIVCHRNYTDAVLGGMDVEAGAASGSITLTGMNGNVECLTYGASTVYEGYAIADGVLTISKDLLDAMFLNLGLGEHTIYVGTDTSYRYAITLTFATKIINTVADLESISTSEATLDGYYILNKDLDCTGKTIALLTGGQKASANIGFKGTFDGRGHIISGLTTQSYGQGALGGLFGQIGAGAVVKNIAFVDMKIVGDYARLLAGDGTVLYGTVENVAVISADSSKRVFGSLSSTSGKLSNCIFININQINVDGGQATVNNILSVTGNAASGYGGFAWSGNATYNAQPNYETINDMFYGLMSDNVLANWSNSLFSYAGGQILFNGKVLAQYENDLQGEATIYRGTEQTYTTNDSELRIELEIAGVTLECTDEDNGIYTLRVDRTVPAGTEIVLVADSLDFNAVSKKLVVTVERNLVDVDLTGEGNKADILVTDGATIPFNETVEAVAYGNADMVTEGVSYTDGKLTLTKDAVAAIVAEVGVGEQTLKLYSADSDNRYVITVTFVTKMISSLEDLKSVATNDVTLDGYYVLTQDITCDGTHFHLPGASGYTDGQGFVGTFDGRGHIIDGYNGDEYGLFWGTRGTAVIKNVAFINVTGTYAMAKNEVHTATFENVYVSGSVKYFTGHSYDASKYKNVIFVSSDPSATLFIDGNNNGNKGAMVLSNVFVVGQQVHGYYGGTYEETNTNVYADEAALLAALSAEGEMDKWAGSPYSIVDGRLLFNGKHLTFTEGTLSSPVDFGDIQTVVNETVFDVPAEITGNIIGIAGSNTDRISDGVAHADGKLTLSKQAAEKLATGGYGETSLKIYTDEGKHYTVSACIVTKALASQADLQSIAIDGTLDGYYVLTNDIVCDGTTEIILAGYTSTTTGGFVGTFDGRGHTISNVNVGTQGFFRGIGAGTVKNVAFVNVISSNVNRTLANETHGCTFENVFVSSNAKYMLQTSWDSPTFKNVVFISSDAAAGRVFNEGDRGTLTATNVFMVGEKLCYYFGGTTNQTNVQAFASADTLLTAIGAAGELDKWADSSFTFADGKLFFNEKLVYQAPISLSGAEVIVRGTSETYTSNGIISIKNPIEGVSIQDGVLTVDYSVDENTIITLVATHPVYASITTELQVQVSKLYSEIDLTDKGIIGDLETADSYSFIKLPEEIDGNITGISYGEELKYTNISVSDGELAIPKAWVTEIFNTYGYSEQSIKLYTDTDKCYTVTVAIVTKAISNQAELLSIANTAENSALDGYYVLTEDIGCDGTTEIILSCYTASADKGFIGTFDGRGHTISNVYVGTQGLFRGIGAGTVKNVAFVNVISDNVNRTLANETHGCTFENVFVSSNAKYMLQSSWDSPTFKNVVFFSSDAAAGRVFNEGGRGTVTATNVFMVGQQLCYFNGTSNQANVQTFATEDALLTALAAENWTDSLFSFADGKLLFAGNPLAFTEATLNTPVHLGDIQTAAKESVLNVPAEITGNIIGISSGNNGRTSEGVTYADGKLTLSQKIVEKLAAGGYGETSLKIYTDEGKYYTVSACIVTKALASQADLQSIAIDGTLDGYFVLTNDIVCDGTTEIILAGYTSTTTGGFIGTFDGRGHTISNVNVGTQGFFRGIGAGTVKNVAFVNVISSNENRTLANETHGCTFENVFVSSNAKYMLQTSYDSPTFKNVVFISSDGAAGRVFYEGGRGTVTATNVFMVGQKLCYFNGTASETNVQAFATEDALLTALAAENWTDSFFGFDDGKLLFNGKAVIQ